MVAGLVMVTLSMAASMPGCGPEEGRAAHPLRGELDAGRSFEAGSPGGFVLRLAPIEGGWVIEVRHPDRPGENLARLTPPWHFVPNPRYLEGWHFRNATNTDPNEGSVNAPQALRDFIFSPEVGRTIDYAGSGTPAEDVERVGAFGRGWLHLERYVLTPPAPGVRASLVWIAFTACLTWPG